MRRFRVAILALMVVIAAGLIGTSMSVARADDEKEGHSGHMRCWCDKHHHDMFRHLGLTKEQKTKIAAIHKKYADEKKGDILAIISAAEKLSKTIHSDTYNENAVREAYRDVSAAGEKMVLLKAKIAGEVNAVLTPEQRTKLQELIAKRFEKIKGAIQSGKFHRGMRGGMDENCK